MQVNVTEIQLEKTGKATGFGLWLLFSICFVANLFAGFISTLMSVYLPVVAGFFSQKGQNADTNEVSAYINALYLAGWAFGGFFWGYISDRIGRVKALALSMAAFGFFTFLVSFAGSWEWVVALRLFSGMAVGGILVITPILLIETWPEASRAVVVGIMSIGFPVGIISSGAINHMTEDWRLVFMIGLLPVCVAILSLWVLNDSELWKNTRNIVKSSWTLSDRDKTNLGKGIVIFGSMLIGMWAMFSWIPTWVQSLVSGSGQSERGLAMMLIGIGGLTGGFISGWVAGLLGVKRAMLFCFAGCSIMSAVLFGLNTSFSQIIYAELAILAIFFGISQGLLSLYIPQLFSVQSRGLATGVCFNVGRIFTAAFVFFVGMVVSALGGYGNTLLVFSGIFIAGFLTIFFTKE